MALNAFLADHRAWCIFYQKLFGKERVDFALNIWILFSYKIRSK